MNFFRQWACKGHSTPNVHLGTPSSYPSVMGGHPTQVSCWGGVIRQASAGALVQPVDTVRDLGVHIDSDLGASTHVRRTVSRCFASCDTCVDSSLTIAFARWLCHLCTRGYGNFLLVGLPVYQQRHLASVLNAAARLVYRLRRYDHITDALATLHCCLLYTSPSPRD